MLYNSNHTVISAFYGMQSFLAYSYQVQRSHSCEINFLQELYEESDN